MNLDQTYKSGQVFRWIHLRDGKYIIPYGPVAILIEQQKNRLIMHCSEEDFYNIWYDYFDLGTDYQEWNISAKHMNEYMKICSVRGSGIHILQQDLFEMIITFMLATATNIPRVKQMLDVISRTCGTKHIQSMREAGKVTWYEFPTPQQILEHQDDIGNLGLERKEHIISLCECIIEGWLDLDELQFMDYESAKEILMEFDGIGPKVADCICLYGLHHTESFPVDTHISDILEREFDCDAEIFKEWFLCEPEQAGIIQQYMFYNEINPPIDHRKESIWV